MSKDAFGEMKSFDRVAVDDSGEIWLPADTPGEALAQEACKAARAAFWGTNRPTPAVFELRKKGPDAEVSLPPVKSYYPRKGRGGD
jgi:hypothetical protein